MATVDTVEQNFNTLFIKQIEERLLDGSAAYLSFIAMLAGVEGLGCYYGGITKDSNGGLQWDNKLLFRNFVDAFFPRRYQSIDFWRLRNSLVHRFIPEKGFHLSVREPAAHFKRANGVVCLNADSLFIDFKNAASAYFEKVRKDSATAFRFDEVCKEVGLLNPSANFKYDSGSNIGTNQISVITILPPDLPLT